MIADLKTLPGALAAEIDRVARKHERWKGYAEDMPPNARAGMIVSMRMMESEIAAAKAAVNRGDIGEMAAALESLKDYDDDE